MSIAADNATATSAAAEEDDEDDEEEDVVVGRIPCLDDSEAAADAAEARPLDAAP